MGMSRRGKGRRLLALASLFASLALTACGSQGYAPTLGTVGTTSLGGAQSATLTLTPFYATHVVVYYLAKQVPYVGAPTPVELRQGSCGGRTLARLTADPTAAGAGAFVAPNLAAKGVDVALTVDQNVYVVILDHANDAQAQPLACGAPLSDRRQYFDLYTPGQGSNGTQLGLTLIEPVVATRVQARLAEPAASSLVWAVYAHDCGSAALASGRIPTGATESDGIVFASAPANGWSASLAPLNASSPVCHRVNG